MTPQSTEIEAVIQRLERLEKRLEKHKNETDETRFWGRWGPLMYILIGAALPISFGVGNTMRSLGEAGQGQRVEAEEFVLKDTAGRVRAKLVVRGNLPQVTLYDSQGHPGSPLLSEPVFSQVPADQASGVKSVPSVSGQDIRKRAVAASRHAITEAWRGLVAQTRDLVPDPGIPGLNLALTKDLRTAGASGQVASRPHGHLIAQLRRDSFTYATGRRTTLQAKPSPTPAAPVTVPAAPPVPATVTSGVPDPSAPGPTPSIPPVPAVNLPPVKLTVLGYVDKPGVGREVAVSDNVEVYVTHEGETFAERFKVLKITPTVVEVLDTYTSQTLNLGLSP